MPELCVVSRSFGERALLPRGWLSRAAGRGAWGDEGWGGADGWKPEGDADGGRRYIIFGCRLWAKSSPLPVVHCTAHTARSDDLRVRVFSWTVRDIGYFIKLPNPVQTLVRRNTLGEALFGFSIFRISNKPTEGRRK